MLAKESDSMTDPAGLDNIANDADKTKRLEKKKKIGRPASPYRLEGDTRLTVRVPEKLHRQLRLASADKGKSMSEIAVEALIAHLTAYENK